MIKVLNQRRSPQCVNDTYITLIPKVKKPQKVGDYRPISLCNVIYKIGIKILENRLKSILHEFISPNQSAFVFGRLNIDNILIAYESLHSMNTIIKGKTSFMTLKLNMSKAYERVE